MYRYYVRYEFIASPDFFFRTEFASDFADINFDWDVFGDDCFSIEGIQAQAVLCEVMLLDSVAVFHGLGAVEAAEPFRVPLEGHDVAIAEHVHNIAPDSREALGTALLILSLHFQAWKERISILYAAV